VIGHDFDLDMRLLLAFGLLSAPFVALACGARTDMAAFDGAAGGGGASEPPPCTQEVCNGVDDDCDGLVDEESPNAGADCLTGLSGPCASGTVKCQSGALACIPIDANCAALNGCSDGTREGFINEASFPQIAACSGGWSVPGILKAPAPACGFQAGNTSSNPSGIGCSAADLCSPGFHVCKGESDVALRSPSGCVGATGSEPLFFATRQGSTGCAICALGDSQDPSLCTGCSCAEGCATSDLTGNDLFGCGTIGQPISNCGVLEVTSTNGCATIGFPWQCGGDLCDEASNVVKVSPEGGGVLCCAD